MDYHFDLHRENTLLFQTFKGSFNTLEILRNQKEMWSRASQKTNFIDCITDISMAKFDEVDFSELKHIHHSVIENFPENIKIRLALINGDNHKSDFIKASTISKFGEEVGNETKNFENVHQAMRWMRLTLKEQDLILSSSLAVEQQSKRAS